MIPVLFYGGLLASLGLYLGFLWWLVGKLEKYGCG